jgi:hypothetical protein
MKRGQKSDGHNQQQADLFSVDPTEWVALGLSRRSWPNVQEFPVNHSGARVRGQVWADIVGSERPLLVAGFSSIAQFIDVSHDWAIDRTDGQIRLLLGSEPFATERTSFAAPAVRFTDEVYKYWLEEHGISIRLSARIINAIDLLDRGRLDVRFVHGASRLHAKIYLGSDAGTVGSSNFTQAGLVTQIEANARFSRTDEPERFNNLSLIADNYWQEGHPWNDQFRALLEAMLRVVSWQEALARASADLLEGDWAARYLASDAAGRRLWPSQQMGIAQALWITENVGSVLVADATGSGKTRMGAHMVRAVRDRLWSSGRVRKDLTVLVCPPAVEDTWFQEGRACGVQIDTVSHGLLSRATDDDPGSTADAVRRAQILAVDEAHNFLSRTARRAQMLRTSSADHVLMFTATPINREAADLLQLIGLLGAENFDDDTLAVLDRLERRRSGEPLSASELATLQHAIQSFTVRRTKTMLNELVARDPGAYRHPVTGRTCRYPEHRAHTYNTGETQDDRRLAIEIRQLALSLTGVARLRGRIAVPNALRHEYTDQRWLDNRLASTKGLAVHSVLGAMRSSKAALMEHLIGTVAAASDADVADTFKPKPTGDVIGDLHPLAEAGPPEIELDCIVPEWLTDPVEWRRRCDDERRVYESIAALARQLSLAREQAKVDLLAGLQRDHERVLAFDHHLITLTVLEPMLRRLGVRVVVATGSTPTTRREVERLFAPTSTETAVALCSDAMNEGLNLQGASAIVHLDLPTTLRVAEQRVGRVDRMDTPHDVIDAFWPKDGPEFATRANELLVRRASESESLLGSNLTVPDLTGSIDPIVDVSTQIEELERPDAELWDGIRDAFEPVRQLVGGDLSLISRAVYDEYRGRTERIASRVSPVRSASPWAFFAVSGSAHGAPRWIMVDGSGSEPLTDLGQISDLLRGHLLDDPPSRPLDEPTDQWLVRFLNDAHRAEQLLLPKRMQRALTQMKRVIDEWVADCERRADMTDALRWRAIQRLTELRSVDEERPDQYFVAQRWLDLMAPRLEAERLSSRRRYVLLRHLDKALRSNPLDLEQVETVMSNLPVASPLAQRVTACILGIPDSG